MNEILLILLAVYGAAAALSLLGKGRWMPLMMLACALVAPVLAGLGLRPREAVEGMFAYLDTLMALLSGAVLAGALAGAGAFDGLLGAWISKKRRPLCGMLGTLLILALPAMLTGSAFAGMALWGKRAGEQLEQAGMDKMRARETVRVGAVLGMLLPPLSLPAMLLVLGRAGSYSPSFEGFFVPLALLALPAMLLYAALNARHSVCGAGAGAPLSKAPLLPLCAVGLLVLSHNFAYRAAPFLGYPLIYAAGFALTLPAAGKKALRGAALGLDAAALPGAMLLGAGALNEMFTLTGVTGGLATLLVQADHTLLLLGALGLLLAAGRWLGVPFCIALCALLPNLINGSGLWGSPLRLVAAGAVLCVLPLLGDARRTLLPGAAPSRRAAAFALCVTACACILGLAGGLDFLMV